MIRQKRVVFRHCPAPQKTNKRTRCVETRFAKLACRTPRVDDPRDCQRRRGTLRFHYILTHVPPRLQPALVVEAGRQTGPMTSSEPPARGRITAKKEATQLNADTQIARRVLTLCGPTVGPTSATRARPNPLRRACIFQALRLSCRDQFWSRIPRLKMVLHLPNPGGLKMQCCVEAVVKVIS